MKLVGDRYAGMYAVSAHAHGAARFDHPREFEDPRAQVQGAPGVAGENEQQREDSGGGQSAKQTLARRG